MIIPAILVATKEELRKKLYAVREHVSLVQLDIMDGTLTARTSFWDPQELEHIKMPLHYELHLMVAHPQTLLPHFSILPNIRRVYVHIECADAMHEVIKEARYHGFEIGIAANPGTVADVIEPHLGEIDGVMFMGVNPGASGQKLIPGVVEKIDSFHKMHPRSEIEVDGGVTKSTIRTLAHAGATRFAVGSAIFDDPRGIKEAIVTLEQTINA